MLGQPELNKQADIIRNDILSLQKALASAAESVIYSGVQPTGAAAARDQQQSTDEDVIYSDVVPGAGSGARAPQASADGNVIYSDVKFEGDEPAATALTEDTLEALKAQLKALIVKAQDAGRNDVLRNLKSQVAKDTIDKSAENVSMLAGAQPTTAEPIYTTAQFLLI